MDTSKKILSFTRDIRVSSPPQKMQSASVLFGDTWTPTFTDNHCQYPLSLNENSCSLRQTHFHKCVVSSGKQKVNKNFLNIL